MLSGGSRSRWNSSGTSCRRNSKKTNNQEYIREQAKKQLKLLNPGEILFTFEEEEAEDKADEAKEEKVEKETDKAKKDKAAKDKADKDKDKTDKDKDGGSDG